MADMLSWSGRITEIIQAVRISGLCLKMTWAASIDMSFISYHVVDAIVLDMIFEIQSLRVRSENSHILVALISLN